MNWTPERIITLIIVVGCFVLIALGIDGEVKSILGMSSGWLIRSLYVHPISKRRKRKNVTSRS